MSPTPRPRTLYVSDLDRTLLTSAGSVSAESARLLDSVVAAGALFTYATARSFLSSRRATEGVPLRLPVITYGGTITVDPLTAAHSDLRLLDRDRVEASLDVCDRHPAAEPILHTFEDGTDWVRWRPERLTAGVRAFLDARPGDPRLRPITADDPLDTAAVFYVSILAENRVLTRLVDALPPSSRAVHFLSVDPRTPGLDWLEIHDAAGTKARAVERLMARIGAERLVVFGDNHNDLPMFAIADEAYAVDDAVPAVKRAATAVIGSNDEDAVARWIADDHEEHGSRGPTRRPRLAR